MQSSDPNLNGFEIDKTESKIYSLQRPQSGLIMNILNTTDGTCLKTYTSAQLSSVKRYSALILDSLNTLAVISVTDSNNYLTICQFTFSNEQFNCISISEIGTPGCIAIVSNANDLFYTAITSTRLIFQRLNFTSATSSYTYNIIGAGTSYPYSNCVVDLSTNLVHTFHSFETSSISSPIFLSLNLTDGSAKSPLYNFSVICSIVYHMESKDDNLYSTGICGLYMTIIVFTKTSNIFKFYKYNTPNTVPYYLTIDPYTDRLIYVGYDSTDVNQCYLAKIPIYQITAFPEVIDSTITSISSLASQIYTNIASPNNISNLSISMASSTLSTLNTCSLVFNNSRSLDSYVSYNLSPYINSCLITNTQYSIPMAFTCTASGTDSIAYSFSDCAGNSNISWITPDYINGLLNFTTPNVSNITNYSFCVTSNVTGDASTGTKSIFLTVLPNPPCFVPNCSTCVSCNIFKCLTCNAGYSLNGDSTACILLPNTSASTSTSTSTSKSASTQLDFAQIITFGLLSMTVIISVILSVFNVSSIMNIFLVFNQMKVLILLFLTEAFFPQSLTDYITGFKFALFNFSYISIQDVLGFNKLFNWADFPQIKNYLYDIGLNSQSAFYNSANFAFMICCCILVHILVRILFYFICKLCSTLRFKKYRDFVGKVVKMFECGLYIRLLLESLVFSSISTFSEINEFNMSTIASQSSFAISILISMFYLFLCVLVTVIWIKMGSNKDLDFNDCWYGEVFKNTKNGFYSRSYTFCSVLRIILLISVLIFSKNYNDKLFGLASFKIYFLAAVQLVYAILICIIRPFNKIDSNIILINSEVSFCILSFYLIYYNSESRWNDTAVNTFKYSVTLYSAVASCVVFFKGTLKLCLVMKKGCMKRRQVAQIVTDNTPKIKSTTPNLNELEMDIMNRRNAITNIRKYLNEEVKLRDYDSSISKAQESHIQFKI